MVSIWNNVNLNLKKSVLKDKISADFFNYGCSEVLLFGVTVESTLKDREEDKVVMTFCYNEK